MPLREIIRVDEEKCNGCGLCIPNCPEGALQVIDGKVRLISDLFCDGLGACIGHCPEGAITIEEREAEPYDEAKTKENMSIGGCPGSRMIDFSGDQAQATEVSRSRPSQLRQWPVQLHLVPPLAPYFQGKDVVLAADCVAYALGDFHDEHLKGKSLAIACPKLDENQGVYIEKITAMIDQAKINTLTVMIMQVPCCGGLLQLAQEAAAKAKRKIPIKLIVVGLQGEILKEEWV
jgi:Fe-S-cluster-containing hydrogenase component 2